MNTFAQLQQQYEGNPRKLKFLAELTKFLPSADPSLLNTLPLVSSGKILDLFDLFQQTMTRGGFEKVTMQNKWAEIGTAVGVPDSTSVYGYYLKWLFSLEKYLKQKQAQQAASATSQTPSQSLPATTNTTTTAASSTSKPAVAAPPSAAPPPRTSNAASAYRLTTNSAPQSQTAQAFSQSTVPPSSSVSYTSGQYSAQANLFQHQQQFQQQQLQKKQQQQQQQQQHLHHLSQQRPLPAMPPRPSQHSAFPSMPAMGYSYSSSQHQQQQHPITLPTPQMYASGAPNPLTSMQALMQRKLSTPAMNVTPGVGTASTGMYIHQPLSAERVATALMDIDSNDITRVVRGLNLLLKKSFDPDSNVSMNLDSNPSILPALLRLLDVVNPLAPFVVEASLKDGNEKNYAAATSSPRNRDKQSLRDVDLLLRVNRQDIDWRRAETVVLHCPTFQAVARSIDENVLVLTLLTILRNLSFDGANDLILAGNYSLHVHLVSLAIASLGAGTMYEASQLAIDMMSNMATRMDLNGVRRFQQSNYNWLEECGQMLPRSKQILKSKLSEISQNDSETGLFASYLAAMELLLSYIWLTIQFNHSRQATISSLDLLAKLVSVPDNALMIQQQSDRIPLVSSIVSLLCVNCTSTDPFYLMQRFGDRDQHRRAPPSVGQSTMMFAAPTPVPPAAKPPAILCNFFQDVNDAEIRDLALEILYTTCSFSATFQLRVARSPHCISLLLDIIRSSRISFDKGNLHQPPSGSSLQRTDFSTLRAVGILSLLMVNVPSTLRLLSAQVRMCLDAFSDDMVADVLCGPGMKLFLPSTEIADFALHEDEVNDPTSNLDFSSCQ